MFWGVPLVLVSADTVPLALHLNIVYCTDGTSYLVLPKAPGDITIFLCAISLLQQAMEFAK